MNNSDIFVGLDIGTTSIKVIIAEFVKNQLNIIGYGNTGSVGLNRGVIVDIDQVVASIKDAVKQAEQRANIDISDVTVGIPANMLQIEQCRGMIAVSEEDGSAKEITEDDVRKVTQAALVQSLPPERSVIDVVPDEFTVDGFDGIKDPRGMVGVRMEMQGVMYTGPKTILHNTKKCVERAGLTVSDIVVAPIALSQVALNDGEQDFGAIVVDLGGGKTTAAVVHDHKLKYTYLDQEGGDYVTRDISVVLNTSIENAEMLKRNYGYAMSSLASEEESFPVQVVGRQEPEKITEQYLSEIIEARLRQIFEKLATALEQINAFQLPGGVVLTGGMAALPGIAELAEEIFQVQVRVYIPQEINLRIPSFTQVIGLVEYATKQSEIDLIVKQTLGSAKAKRQNLDNQQKGNSRPEQKPVKKPKKNNHADEPKKNQTSSEENGFGYKFKHMFDNFFD
ncbi:MAG TPA: cell division protein FtsA [Ligilactobacillus acidipiscis]|uniref:Cell division protein FtsA n=1 Tax=Ligilactobacillus acidipiscis TaxID=89059 RepID=A0A921F8U6_9LACO|nr:cell division protein FtsA [Ligilactobacillus acidipiscis]